jgi:2-oxoglutarate ferredoxin oxidoreductase subunit alpha
MEHVLMARLDDLGIKEIDYLIANHAEQDHSGSIPAVLVPATSEEAFHAIIKAFNLAERYQTPMIVLTGHHLATSYAAVERFDLNRVEIERGELLSDEEVAKLTDYKRHLVTDSGISPRALPGQGKALVVTDSDEPDKA